MPFKAAQRLFSKEMTIRNYRITLLSNRHSSFTVENRSNDDSQNVNIDKNGKLIFDDASALPAFVKIAVESMYKSLIN